MIKRKSRKWSRVTTIHHFKDLDTVRVFGIARVSTDKQAKHGESLEHQREVIANWAKAKASINSPQEWRLVEFYVENEDRDGAKRGRTATKREGRLGLAKALELAKARLIDVIVVTKLDRIARNVKDYINISAEFNESEVALVCLDLDIDTSTPDGQMIMRNHANLAQWQAERIAQYSIETARRHASQGRPLGSPPVGYQAVKDGNGKTTLEIHPVYKKHLHLIDKLYLLHQSVDRVVQELHKKGFKTPRKKTYSKPQVSRILQNIRYTGRQEYDGQTLAGNWKPLRSLSTHEKIQKILHRNRNTNHSPTRLTKSYVYLFQGLLKCHRCHSSMSPRPAIGRKGHYYPYYMCTKADKTEGIDCEEIYLPGETIDSAIIEFIKKLRLDSSTIERVVGRANEATSTRISSLKNDQNQLKERLKDIRTQTSNLVDILAKKGVSQLDALKDKLESLDRQEKELALEEKRLEQEIRAEKAQAGAAHDQIQTLTLFNEIFLLNQNHPERIKAILPRFVNYVVCHIADKKKGIGRLDVGLFGRPFAGGPNAEIWNDCLRQLAEGYDKSLTKSKKAKSSDNGKDLASPGEHINSARVLPGPEPACGSECVPVRGRVTKRVGDGDRTRDPKVHNLVL